MTLDYPYLKVALMSRHFWSLKMNKLRPNKAIHIFIDDHAMIDKMIELLDCDLLDQFEVSDYIDRPMEFKHAEESEIFDKCVWNIQG